MKAKALAAPSPSKPDAAPITTQNDALRIHQKIKQNGSLRAFSLDSLLLNW
jgi:hypothetical protein